MSSSDIRLKFDVNLISVMAKRSINVLGLKENCIGVNKVDVDIAGYKQEWYEKGDTTFGDPIPHNMANRWVQFHAHPLDRSLWPTNKQDSEG